MSKRLEVRPSIVSDLVKSFQEAPDPTAWLSESRNSKSNKLTEESRESIRKFWHANSRPTGDKQDVVRKHIGLKQYTQHPRQILEEIQTELYLEFCKSGSGVKCSQSLFEKEKPYYVKTATRSDRNSCLCRKHVEIHKVFKDFMKLRKKFVKENPTENSLPCYERLTELVEETLCERPNGQKFHNLSCVMCLCDKCGIKKLKFSDQEISQDGENVKWSRFKYVVVKGVENSDGTPKETSINCFREDTSRGID